MISGEIFLKIHKDIDIITARQSANLFAKKIGFSGSWPTIVSTITSGLARNILKNNLSGQIFIDSIHKGLKYGISITANQIKYDDDDRITPVNKHSSGYSLIDLESLIPRHIIDELEAVLLNNREKNIKIIKWLN